MKMPALLFFHCCVLLSSAGHVYAQLLGRPVSASGLSAYSEKIDHALVVQINPAAVTTPSRLTVALGCERRFMLSELTALSACVVFPVKKGGFGLSISKSGNASLSTISFGTAYGKSLGKGLSLGVQFNYSNSDGGVYGTLASLYADCGMLIQVAKGLRTGFSIRNIGKVFSETDGEPSMRIELAGALGYDISSQLFLAFGMAKQWASPVGVEAALRYFIVPGVFVIGGLETSAGSPFLSAGVDLRWVRIIVRSSYHQQLGLSPQLILSHPATSQ